MRITNVEADIVRIPLSTRFSGSVYQIESRCTIVVRVHTDEGLVSEIYSGDERTGYELLKDLVVGPMAEAVKGEDPMANRAVLAEDVRADAAHWQQGHRNAGHRRHRRGPVGYHRQGAGGARANAPGRLRRAVSSGAVRVLRAG